MKTRILFVTAVAFVGLALAPSMATAQVPTNEVRMLLDWAHAEMTVPDTGRADMEVVAKLQASGFACAQACSFSVELKLDSFAKWAGASLEPFTATFNFAPGEPGPNPVIKESVEDIKLNLAWDLETAPRANAKQVYVVSTGKYNFQGGPAVPQYRDVAAKSPPMTATLPDRPVEVNATTAVDCQMDPFNPACANAATTAAAESPGIDMGILIASVAALGFAFRRRRE